mmetsp:Transcript_61312/g.158135  ORF Transcript_61312/g.158135 Transcript_61312/m.158135 type:complete len:582 (-) Transcript_61312:76-1821(-)
MLTALEGALLRVLALEVVRRHDRGEVDGGASLHADARQVHAGARAHRPLYELLLLVLGAVHPVCRPGVELLGVLHNGVHVVIELVSLLLHGIGGSDDLPRHLHDGLLGKGVLKLVRLDNRLAAADAGARGLRELRRRLVVLHGHVLQGLGGVQVRQCRVAHRLDRVRRGLLDELVRDQAVVQRQGSVRLLRRGLDAGLRGVEGLLRLGLHPQRVVYQLLRVVDLLDRLRLHLGRGRNLRRSHVLDVSLVAQAIHRVGHLLDGTQLHRDLLRDGDRRDQGLVGRDAHVRGVVQVRHGLLPRRVRAHHLHLRVFLVFAGLHQALRGLRRRALDGFGVGRVLLRLRLHGVGLLRDVVHHAGPGCCLRLGLPRRVGLLLDHALDDPGDLQVLRGLLLHAPGLVLHALGRLPLPLRRGHGLVRGVLLRLRHRPDRLGNLAVLGLADHGLRTGDLPLRLLPQRHGGDLLLVRGGVDHPGILHVLLRRRLLHPRRFVNGHGVGQLGVGLLHQGLHAVHLLGSHLLHDLDIEHRLLRLRPQGLGLLGHGLHRLLPQQRRRGVVGRHVRHEDQVRDARRIAVRALDALRR